MSSKPVPQPPIRADLQQACQVFSEYLRARPDTPSEQDIEDLCSRHPSISEAIRILNSVYLEGRSHSLAARLPAGAPNSDRLTFSLDPEPDPEPGFESSPESYIATALPGARGQRYVHKGEVGRGGMGTILRVWDRNLRRTLAMKVMNRKGREQPGKAPTMATEALARFLEEAQVTGQLDHPGIVPVHELGVDAGENVYFTMQLVKGKNLTEIIQSARKQEDGWNLPRVIGVLVKSCQAVSYAHAKGVIHRDLKPANVMVGQFGEVYVMDWGLAKVKGRDDLHDLRIRPNPAAPLTSVQTYRKEVGGDPEAQLVTMDGEIVGTPAYMPPEQAEGKLEEVDAGSDVYSLGALLYTALTGCVPYVPPGSRLSPHIILAQVLSGPPRPIHEIDRRAPAELVAICEKAMARDKSDRYRSALDLAEDLQAFLDNRVVRAYEQGAFAELKKLVRRNPETAVAVATAALLLLAGLLAVLFVQQRANRSLLESSERIEEQSNLAQERFHQVLRLTDARRLDEAIAEAEQLWPPHPEVVPAMESWLAKAEELAGRTAEHQKTLEELRSLEQETPGGAAVTRTGAGRPGLKEDLELQRDLLTGLLDRLRIFQDPDPFVGTLSSLRQRIEIARTLRARSIDQHESEWKEAIASIRDTSRCPLYGGLEIAPQLGLVPLGRNPRSGLWEFAHLLSGEPARVRPDGTIEMSEASGIVLVLVPGGEFRMGARQPDPRSGLELGDPNVDPNAFESESPIHTVKLSPYFISKFEMTQAQWLRIAGKNPSGYQPGQRYRGYVHNLLHPVEQVSWVDSTKILGRLGLVLPTEAQWEYATRAGTSTIWWTGNERSSVENAGNLYDKASWDLDAEKPSSYVSWTDPYWAHAPIGCFLPNPWGLYDVIGNVTEWCRDGQSDSYKRPPEPGTGLHANKDDTERAHRGGAWNNHETGARSARRQRNTPSYRNKLTGVRPARELEI